MDDKSRKDQRHQPGITDFFSFADRISSQKTNRESLRGIFWEVELPWGGDRDRTVPTATAPGAALPLLPKVIHTGIGGTFGTEDRHFRFFCQRKLLERCFNQRTICEAKPPDKDPEPPFCCGLVGEGPSRNWPMCNQLVTLCMWFSEREGLNLYISRIIMGWASPSMEHLQVQQCWVPGKASWVPEAINHLREKLKPSSSKTFELLTWKAAFPWLGFFSQFQRFNLWEQRATLAGDAVLIEPIAASPSCFVCGTRGLQQMGQIGLGLSSASGISQVPSQRKNSGNVQHPFQMKCCQKKTSWKHFPILHGSFMSSWEILWILLVLIHISDGKYVLYPNLSKLSFHPNIFPRMGQTKRCIIHPQAGTGCEGPSKPPVTLTLPSVATGSLSHSQN